MSFLKKSIGKSTQSMVVMEAVVSIIGIVIKWGNSVTAFSAAAAAGVAFKMQTAIL